MITLADIQALANRAGEIYRGGGATSWSSAVRKAIRGQGITFGPDVERLTSQVCSELGRRSGGTRRKKAQQQKEEARRQARYEDAVGHAPLSEPEKPTGSGKHQKPRQLILL